MTTTRRPTGHIRGVMPTTPPDEEAIRAFPKYEGAAEPGYITDFLGVRTRTAYITGLQTSGHVEGYPIPANFHATGVEWAGVLRAVLEAGNELVAVELGAGWAPWLVTAARAAQIRGIPTVRLVGVEGAIGHIEYMKTHFADNGLDPAAHTLLHGIAAAEDGVAEFPVLDDPAAVWGAVAILPGQSRPADNPRTESIQAYSLPTVLKPFPVVDVVHIDIQGHEADVVVASRDVIRDKVKRMVIGTHGRQIEQQLMDELAPREWTLESEEPCIFQQNAGGMVLLIDGCQVWRNRRLAPDPT